jgi:hypothetical protein
LALGCGLQVAGICSTDSRTKRNNLLVQEFAHILPTIDMPYYANS